MSAALTPHSPPMHAVGAWELERPRVHGGTRRRPLQAYGPHEDMERLSLNSSASGTSNFNLKSESCH